MVTPMFTLSSGVTFTFNEGDVENISSSINANLDNDAMPLSPPTDALLFDFTGTNKTITLAGKISNSGTTRTSSGTTITIDAQRKWFELILNGNQVGVLFTSNYSSSWDGTAWTSSPVMISGIEWNEVNGEPSSLQFRITLLVGAI